MRSYIDASAAFGECLERQVKLGARIVAAAQALLGDQSAAEMQESMVRLTQLRKDARSGNAELTKLRRAVRRAKSLRAHLPL
jgi:hypothetical protein